MDFSGVLEVTDIDFFASHGRVRVEVQHLLATQRLHVALQ